MIELSSGHQALDIETDSKYKVPSTKIKVQRPLLIMSNTSSASAFVSLGSNLGDRAGNLLAAISGILDARLKLARLSSIYETEPVETIQQPAFLNLVAELCSDTLPPPEELMARLLRVEQELGRTREVAKGPRTIDLDLLLYGNETRATDYLTLPHPRFHLRRFVLIPLAQLNAELVHPSLGKTISQLLEDVEDKSEVKRWQP